MNKLLPSLLCLLFLLAGASASFGQVKQPVEWREFTSAEGRFKVLLPGAPERSVKDLIIAGDTVVNHRFAAAGDELYLRIAYCDHPSYNRYLTDAERQQIYYDLMRGWMLGVLPGAKLVGERDLVPTGNPGREWSIEVAGDMHIRYRLAIKGNRLYQVMATYFSAGAVDAQTQARIDRFMNSFEALER